MYFLLDFGCNLSVRSSAKLLLLYQVAKLSRVFFATSSVPHRSSSLCLFWRWPFEFRWVKRWERSEKRFADGQRMQTSGRPPFFEGFVMMKDGTWWHMLTLACISPYWLEAGNRLLNSSVAPEKSMECQGCGYTGIACRQPTGSGFLDIPCSLWHTRKSLNLPVCTPSNWC